MAKYLGRLVFIKVDNNGVGGAGASWVTIGQQTDSSWDGTNENVDGTTKADAGWKNEVQTGRAWKVSCEGKLDASDSIWTKLYNAWANGTKLYIQIDESSIGGSKREVQAYVEVSVKYPMKDLVSFTANFSCQGAPVPSVV